MPTPLYEPKSGSPLLADQSFYGRLGSEVEKRTLNDQFIVPIRSGKAWPVRAGQLCRIVAVAGPQVVPGYWRNADATSAAFRDDWLLTGDVGYVDDDGCITCSTARRT